VIVYFIASQRSIHHNCMVAGRLLVGRRNDCAIIELSAQPLHDRSVVNLGTLSARNNHAVVRIVLFTTRDNCFASNCVFRGVNPGNRQHIGNDLSCRVVLVL
jgi:hypothetical protein